LFSWIKQRIDQAAIDAAAKSLAPGITNPAKAGMASEMLQRPDLFRPAEITAQLRFSGDRNFQFTSLVSTDSARNDTVHGRLFRTGDNWARRPLVLLIHGWNAELHYMYVLPLLARALNRAGLNAALIELPYHMHRRPQDRNGMRDFISDDLPAMLRATQQAISDIDSLCRWALAQGCPKTAVWGFSLGAWLSGLYICESDLPAAAVLTTPVADLQRGVSELAFCHPIRAGLGSENIDLRPLNLMEKRPRLSSKVIQVVQSQYDLFVPEESYQQVASAWNLDGWVTEPQGHISILASRAAMKRSIQWLVKRLRSG
jgi:pimeloyl-ACP methyl ester carboxylesterase